MRKVVLFVPFLLGFAFAQEVAPVAPDVGAWFASTTALAGIVVVVVAFLKKRVFVGADGLVVVIISLATGAVLGIVGNLLGYVEGSIVAAIGFGVSAGLLASGGWDAVTGALSKSRAG